MTSFELKVLKIIVSRYPLETEWGDMILNNKLLGSVGFTKLNDCIDLLVREKLIIERLGERRESYFKGTFWGLWRSHIGSDK